MRTLQEKYNAINEGNFSKDQFLRDARMQLPNLVTQYNGYDDAVQILKNRGMIQEIASFAERFKEYSDDALADIIINLSRYEGNEKDIEPVKAELARRKGNVDEISADTFKSAVDVARGRGEDRRASNLGSTFLNSFVGKLLMGGTISRIDIQKPSFGDYFDVTLEVLVPTQGTDGMYDKPKYLYYDVENDDWGMKGKGLEVTRQDARVLSQIAIKVNPDTKYRQGTQHFDIVGMNEARLTKNNLTDYRYKPTNDMDKYPYEQILRGLRVELEGLGVMGTPTPEQYTKALAKVLKNLEKDTIFYTNQVAGINKKVDLHDKMVDVKKDNTVDKFNGMKKAELKEAIKGVIKNILSENSDPDLYDQDEERQERANDHGDYGPVSDFGDYYPEPDEDLYEMQGPKTDAEYKAELRDYLKDNQIYGHTDMLFHILTDPNEETVGDKLWSFLEDYEKVEHYKNLMAIFRDYANNNENQYTPDEDDEIDYDDENFSDPFIDGDLDESKTGDLHILAQESDTLRTFLKAVKSQYPDMDLNKAAQGLQFVWNNRNQGMDESVSLKDIL